jgi:hypothetical protein
MSSVGTVILGSSARENPWRFRLRLHSISAFIDVRSIMPRTHSCICRDVSGTKNGCRFSSIQFG